MVNLGILKAVGREGGQQAADRYATIVLPIGDGTDVTLVRTRPTVLSASGFTRRGRSETGERAVLMLWNDGHASGYFGYKGRLFGVSHMVDDIHAMAEIDPTSCRRTMHRRRGASQEAPPDRQRLGSRL